MGKISALLSIAVLALLFTAVSACATNPPAGVTPIQGVSALDQAWMAPKPDSSRKELASIAEAVAIARPSVVAIHTETVVRNLLNRSSNEEGDGSGWIIDGNGIIVTNNHVVDGATRITVTLSDGRVLDAEAIKTDALTDLAIVKVNARGLPAAKIGDASSLRVGDWVLTIGNPLGLGISAKEGIVSRLHAPISVSPGQTLHDLIETSAAINPGNSGGPLVNLAGEVVGITSAKIGRIGVEGMGYAINVNAALPIIEALVRSGCVVRAWLGLETLTLEPAVVSGQALAVQAGAQVENVVPGGPADRAGINKGDIIVGFDARNIAGAAELTEAETSSQIGQKVSLALWRGKDRMNLDIVLAESPPCKY